jgi:hypothetical protein
MATHIITVNYVVDPVTHKGTVDVAPKVTHAKTHDTLDFRQKDSSPGTMRITFREKGLFSTKNPKFSTTGKFFKGDGLVSVTGTKVSTTLFDCELLGPPPDEKVLVTSTGPGSGGAIEIRNG